MRGSLGILLVALLLAGCGTTGGGDEPAGTPTPTVAADERSIDAVEERLQELARRQDAAKKAGDTELAERLEREIVALERRQDAAVEEEFPADEPYDAAIDALPLREPPLYVVQFLTDDTHELVARVRPRRFFCGRTPEQRLAAVRAYYDEARRTMIANDIVDFVLVVDETRETGTVTPLARAQGDEVALTARGRGKGPC